ncbi:YadA-like family protein [Salmonella enterica]|nr:YadA-like family protein [Salmonella enterica]
MCLFKVILLVGIELFLLQILGFPRKNSYQEENILENSDNLGSGALQGCKAGFLKSTNFTLSSLVLTLFLSSNMAYADGNWSTATGAESNASEDWSTATGGKSNASGIGSTATGGKSDASGDGSTATGAESNASEDWSTATGGLSNASGDGSTATGSYSKASGDYSVATGALSEASGKNSVALGANSKASHDNEVNIGIWDMGVQTGRTLSGLADGTNDDEAVNKRQLDKAISAVSGGVSKNDAQKMADGAKTAAEKTAKGYADTAESNANNHTNTEIKNLDTKAQGYASTAQANAVTHSKAYTDESSARTLESANTYTNHRAAQAENNAVARSNNYTDNRFGELRQSLEHTEKRLNAGIAGVTALSSIPYAAGNKFSYGIGAGNYQNGNAVAAGVQFRVSQSTNVRLNISWDSAGNNATGVGIAGGW